MTIKGEKLSMNRLLGVLDFGESFFGHAPRTLGIDQGFIHRW